MVYINVMFPIKSIPLGHPLSAATSQTGLGGNVDSMTNSVLQFPYTSGNPLLPLSKTLNEEEFHDQHFKEYTQERKKRYQCARCNLKFTRNSSLKRHIKSKHLLLKYKCDICPNYYNKRKDYLKRHMFIKHGMGREEFDSKNYTQDYVYEDPRHGALHIDAHADAHGFKKLSPESADQDDEFEDEEHDFDPHRMPNATSHNIHQGHNPVVTENFAKVISDDGTGSSFYTSSESNIFTGLNSQGLPVLSQQPQQQNTRFPPQQGYVDHLASYNQQVPIMPFYYGSTPFQLVNSTGKDFYEPMLSSKVINKGLYDQMSMLNSSFGQPIPHRNSVGNADRSPQVHYLTLFQPQPQYNPNNPNPLPQQQQQQQQQQEQINQLFPGSGSSSQNVADNSRNQMRSQ